MLLLIISGESGVGKTTIEKKIANDTSLNFTRIISVTTRKQRKDEKPNFDYYFISKEKFKEELKKNNFIEHISYDDNYYGIYRRDIDFLFDKKKNCVVSAGVEGTKQIKRYFLKKNLCVVSI